MLDSASEGSSLKTTPVKGASDIAEVQKEVQLMGSLEAAIQNSSISMTHLNKTAKSNDPNSEKK